MFKKSWFYVSAAAALLVLCAMVRVGGTAQAAPNDPLDVWEAAAARFNAGDLPGSVALYAEDAVLTDSDIESGKSFAAVGREAIGTVLEGAMATHLEIEETGISVNGDVVTVTGRWSDDVSSAAGVTRYLATSNVAIRDGKIARYALTYNTADPQTLAYLAYSAAQPLTPPPGTLTFPMGAGRDGSQIGESFFAPAGSVTYVFAAIAPGATGELQPAELQSRACPAIGPVVSELAPVLNGFSLSIVSQSIDELQDVSLHVQKLSGLSTLDVSCGDASDAVLVEEPAPAPAPVAPAPRPVTAPNTGTGDGARDRSMAFGVALLVMIGVACVAGGAMRRRVL